MPFDPTLISKILDGMVSDSAVGDHLSMRRHRSFIAAHLGVGLVALSILPIWLAVFGPTSMAEAMTFSWFVAPLAIAGFLSRTGRLEIAHLASAAAFTGLIVWVAGQTGGVYSLALAWLPLVSFESSLSGSRKVTAAATAIAILGFLLLSLAFAGFDSLAAESVQSPLIEASLVIGAILYGGILSLRAEGLTRQSARAARLGEERYQLLAGNATDMITCHSANGDVEFASPSARSLTGSSASDVLGDGLFRRVHIADRPAYLEVLSGAYTSRRPDSVVFRLRNSGIHADAEGSNFIPVEMRCRPAIDRDGSVSAVVAVTRDIAKRRQRENELNEAYRSTDRANQATTERLAQLGRELRAPLNTIIDFSEALASGEIDEGGIDRRREYAKMIRNAGERCLGVVSGVADMSNDNADLSESVPEPMQLAPLIADCCNSVDSQAIDRGICIVRAIPDDLPEILADRNDCRQILLNLLANAINSSDRGGIVTAGARAEIVSIEIFVEDGGDGNSADELSRPGDIIGEPDGGCVLDDVETGSRLSNVRRLAALHGGHLRIESAPGAGNKASVLFPVERMVMRQPEYFSGQSYRPTEENKERKSA